MDKSTDRQYRMREFVLLFGEVRQMRIPHVLHGRLPAGERVRTRRIVTEVGELGLKSSSSRWGGWGVLPVIDTPTRHAATKCRRWAAAGGPDF